ncbi:LTA synthase family protein [Anaerotalea alkaliphila]|uniref:Sulfatase-like hydrolase/transferase n=1 Tax=Anaerotalea alkaliphila TaxID=2662126 RepID=A0A7X5HUA4_9FIRM|nr:LTA synthase family protein [Anaerotalea alkaliphila]NDL66786.1 sulfatase-like hydrolase/transferase [Anaerotalea alkaliphila]
MFQKKIHSLPMMPLLALALTFLLEVFGRHSVGKALGYAFSNPLMFLYNMMIVLLTLSISTLFRRRRFMLLLIAAIWFLLGCANFMVLSFRITPLGAIDFQLLKSVIGIVGIYISFYQAVLILLAFCLLVVGVVYSWRRLPPSRVRCKSAILTIGATAGSLLLVSNLSVQAEALSQNFDNITDAYSENGFAYSFSSGLVDRGIKKPEDYSQERMAEVAASLEGSPSLSQGRRPNLVMVQLESFFDVNRLENLDFSQNPLPHFTRLRETFSTGLLEVPSIGSGTANTEFEVLTGMNLEYFGSGEYPYKTVLQEAACESLGYHLRKNGYAAHAIHNNTATFYDRNLVYSNLGFERFSPIEYMNDVRYNPTGWAKDEVLTGEIRKALASGGSRDFIYAVSVQPHGKYPEAPLDENQRIFVEGLEEDAAKASFEYYANQIFETDAFVGELLRELSAFGEPTVVVLFGDHLPALAVEEEDLREGGRFQTEYVIWSNFPLEKQDKDLTAYQLGAEVMERMGLDEGILTKLHQNRFWADDYQEMMVLLQYDMLYGEQAVYARKGSAGPPEGSVLGMGISPIVITGIQQSGESVQVSGLGFTPWSVVHLDGKAKETRFLDDGALLVEDLVLEKGSRLHVAQVARSKEVLSRTAGFIVQ